MRAGIGPAQGGQHAHKRTEPIQGKGGRKGVRMREPYHLVVVEGVGESVLHEGLCVDLLCDLDHGHGNVGRQAVAAEAVVPVLAVLEIARLKEVRRRKERVVAVQSSQQFLLVLLCRRVCVRMAAKSNRTRP